MNNKKSKDLRSISLSNFECYRTEEINKIFRDSNYENILLLHYIDTIRNYKILDNDMLKRIQHFNDDNKMKIIQEFNDMMGSLIEIVTNDKT
jgi:hypothetical protein